MWPFKRKIQKEPTERDEAFTKFLKEKEAEQDKQGEAFKGVVSFHQKLRGPYDEMVGQTENIQDLTKKVGGELDSAEAEIGEIKKALDETKNIVPDPAKQKHYPENKLYK